MNTPAEPQDEWIACCPGELQRMVGRIKNRQRRQFLIQLGAAASTIVVLGAGGYFALRQSEQPTEYRYGGIACSEVMPLLPEYRVGKLDPELTRQITVHLEKCPNCGPMYRRMIGEMASTRPAALNRQA
jgi:hypothetical protein